MQKQVTAWKGQQNLDEDARLVIYRAFIQESDFLTQLTRFVPNYYFNPEQPEFAPRTMSAFKALDPIPQFKATARLGVFLERSTETHAT